MRTASQDFIMAFKAAGGQSAASYMDLMRFITVMIVILALLWALIHFMGAQAKQTEDYLETLASRSVRIMIGLTLFILILTP